MSDAVVYIGMTYPHGIIRHFVLLALEIQKHLAVDFFFASTTGETNQNAWPLVRAHFAPDRVLATETFPRLVASIECLFSRYDRVLVHTGGGWGQTKHFIPLKRKYGNRFVHVVTTHSFHIGDWKRVPMSILQAVLYSRYVDQVVFQCPYAVSRFTFGDWFLKRGRGCIVPLGVESYPEKTEVVPTELEGQRDLVDVLLDGSLVKFIYLAGFRVGKCHAWLMRAVAPTLKANPKARLLLCGRGDPKIIDDVKMLAKRFGVQGQVVIPGQIHRDAVPWVLQHATCALVPTAAETFGHCFVEPMFAGLPVIGTRVGIGRSLVQDFRTGFGISLKDPASVVRALQTVLDDPEGTREMGAYARTLVSLEFTHASVGLALARLYQTLLSRRRST